MHTPRLTAKMDYTGVDVPLLHTDPMLGRDSRYRLITCACIQSACAPWLQSMSGESV